MIKLKKKPKAKPLSPSALADKINQIGADAEGITLKEYYKRQAIRNKQQEEYSKTHWVSWLTEAQRHLIATTTVKPYKYMGKPLSKENAQLVEMYKSYHPNYRNYKKNYDEQIPKLILNTLKGQNKELEGTYLEEVGRDIWWTHITNNKAELIKQFGKPFEDAYDSYKKGQGKKSRDELAKYLKEQKIVKALTIEKEKQLKLLKITNARASHKLQEAMDSFNKVKQEYLDIGRKLKGSFTSQTLTKMKQSIVENRIPLEQGIGSLPHPFSFSTINKAIDGTSGIGGLLDPVPLVDKSHGLNTLMKKRGMKSVFELAPHYLKTFKDKNKADYFVDSFDNAIALADATGVGYQRLFEIICNELVKRDKHYRDEAMLGSRAIMIEELINIFEGKSQSKTSIKYTQKAFFNSSERKEWSAKHSYHWKDYKRFNEQFPKWLRIFKARAFKKGTKSIDEIIEEQKKLRKIN